MSFYKKLLKTNGDANVQGRMILLRTLKAPDTTTGGKIFLTDKHKDARLASVCIGQVLALGNEAYSERNGYTFPYCKEGDYVRFDMSEQHKDFMTDDEMEKRLPFSTFFVPDYSVWRVIDPKDLPRFGLLPHNDY